jgi:uncharacterized repeat protein (TIGR03803 family)
MRTLGVIRKLLLVAGTAFATFAPLNGAHAFGVLHTFHHGGSDGEYPSSGLIEDAAGNLYGTTGQGGPGCGIVFKLASDGTETVLYRFACGSGNGSTPYGGLIADSAGNLYGTTIAGGGSGCGGFGCGAGFKLAPDGNETVLYAFRGGSDGAYPYSDLIADAAGNVYGTTSQGGGAGCQNGEGCGTVFKVMPDGSETVLYTFTGGSDGASPITGLTVDGQGNLYGTTPNGGKSGCIDGCGVVFRLAPDGAETVLYAFTGGNDGANPYGGLMTDTSGNLYSTTALGGRHGKGAVFMLAPNGAETVLYAFRGGSDGGGPQGGLIEDMSGDLYGTTVGGGANKKGVVFKLAPDGTETVLHAFGGGTGGGVGPAFGLVTDNQANLYGTTSNGGGKNDNGTVFKLRE